MVCRVIFQPAFLQDGKQRPKLILLLRSQDLQHRRFLAAVFAQHLRLVLCNLPAERKLPGERIGTAGPFDFIMISPFISAQKTPSKHFCLPGETA